MVDELGIILVLGSIGFLYQLDRYFGLRILYLSAVTLCMVSGQDPTLIFPHGGHRHFLEI